MKIIRYMACALVALILASCNNTNENLEKVIPADAAGVISIDLSNIAEKGKLINDDNKFEAPASLSEIIDANDVSPLCQMLVDFPVMGINFDSKAYAFFTVKTFGYVMLLAIDDEKAACESISRRTGQDFKQVEGLNCVFCEDNFYTVHNGVLFIGHVNKPMVVGKAAGAAKRMLEHNAASIVENEEVKACIDADNDINAYLQLDGLKLMLNGSNTYRDIAQKMPLVEIFTESDVNAYIASANFNEASVDLDINIKVDDNSEYIKLLSSTMSNPSADFLKVIPVSMDYIAGMSVKGENFVKLSQIEQLIKVFNKLPYIGRLDISSMLATIDGPVAAGMSHDDNIDEWNTVIAAKSTNPNAILGQIARFASALGQAPEIYNNEYIYQYDNKMIKLGVADGVLYIKLLTYDMTEDNAYDNTMARDLFSKSQLASYINASDGNKGGKFVLGLTGYKSIKGQFVPADNGNNAIVALLQVLCGIKPAMMFDDVVPGEYVPGAIDELRPVN